LFLGLTLLVFLLLENPALSEARFRDGPDDRPLVAVQAAPPASAVGPGSGSVDANDAAGVADESGPSSPVPRPLSSYSLAHLYELMSREPLLSKNEIIIYQKHLPAIVALDADPAGLGAVLEATGLTQTRLVYVVTKVGVGLSCLLYPDDAKFRDLPDFMKPTPPEQELLRENLDKLVEGFRALYAPESKPGLKRPVSRKS
jgi:hypothetical protein